MTKMKNHSDQPTQASIEFPADNESRLRGQSNSAAVCPKPKSESKVVSVVGIKQAAMRTMLITQLKKLGF